MPFIEAAFAHSAPQLSELERTMCFAHGQVSDLAHPHLSLQCVKHIVKFPDLAQPHLSLQCVKHIVKFPEVLEKISWFWARQ